jgi:hypothetical protein
MWQADDQTHRYVMRAAAAPGALADDLRASVSLREMAALGAVEVLTGRARALRRKRRRPERTLESLWQTLGVARPGKADDTPTATEVP